MALPIRSPYILNGELDKRAHPILRDLGIDNVTPDFLVHTPGSMDGNFAVIEVKNTISPRGVQKDLDTLDRFVRKAGYKRAIYLLYGREATDHGLSRIKEMQLNANRLNLWRFGFTQKKGSRLCTRQHFASHRAPIVLMMEKPLFTEILR